MKYRPWGPVEWVMSLSAPREWHFVGVIGTEERSLCAWKLCKHLRLIRGELFTQIRDIDSAKHRSDIHHALNVRRSEFSAAGGQFANVQQHDLLAELFLLSEFADAAIAAGPAIILDVTSFPKRFFFPILKKLVLATGVRDLILTYTSPSSYAPEDEPLYEDIEPWNTLPGFAGAPSGNPTWIVSVGFLVESLLRYANDNQIDGVKVLIPFPAPLSALRRTWQAVYELEKDARPERFDNYRVDVLDMSAAFDRICSLAGQPAQPLAFAPFGPKPTAAAMCLYAMQKNCSVHYAQPKVYHPAYSVGIKNSVPKDAVAAYWVKHDGENLYAV